MSDPNPTVVYDFSGTMMRYQGYQRARTLLNDLKEQGLIPVDDSPQVLCRLPGQGETLRYYLPNDQVKPGRIAVQEGVIGVPEVPWYWVGDKRVTNLAHAV